MNEQHSNIISSKDLELLKNVYENQEECEELSGFVPFYDIIFGLKNSQYAPTLSRLYDLKNSMLLESHEFKVPVTVHIEDTGSDLHVKEGFKLSEKGIDTIKSYL